MPIKWKTLSAKRKLLLVIAVFALFVIATIVTYSLLSPNITSDYQFLTMPTITSQP